MRAWLALLLVTGGLVGPAAAQSRGLRDSAEVEAFFDGAMTAWLRDKHIAGVTVSVVKNGALFFAKGYGYADVAAKKPVDPAKTLFRIGSISKPFTWTAVMQLVERGKLDLDRDVNEYLDFKIPATYPEPITLRHILTHTPGFEEDSRDLFVEDPAHLSTMKAWLPTHMPARVRKPGTFSSYSNYATAVAGYIVERVSGMDFDEYLEKNILNPLAMTQTTSRQPLPDRFAADMSVGYKWDQGHFEPEKWEIITGAKPAGSVSASATDMARFMLAHLGNGALGDARILADSTAIRMYSRIQGHDDRLPGFAHGFYEQSGHGLRIFGHGGDTQWFHSDMALIPSEKVGIFMSTNTNTGGSISFKSFLDAFLDHYYPEDLAVITPTAGAKAGARRYAGEYVFNRMSYTTFQKVVGLFGSLVVTPAEDGALVTTTPFGAIRLISVDSMLFRDAVSGDLVAFRADDRGKITHGFLSMAPMMVMEKRPGLSSPRLHQVLLGLGVVTFVGILISAVLRFFRRRSGTEPAAAPTIASGRRVMALVAVLQVVFLAVLAVAVSGIEKGLPSGAPTSLKVGLLFPVLGAILTAGALWIGITQWRKAEGTTGARLRHLGAVAIAAVFFLTLNAWNLLGWHY